VSIKPVPRHVIATATLPSGQIVFLETGNANSGLTHIIDQHAQDFANVGISENQIPNVIMDALTEGQIVGYQGKGTGRPIYQIEVNGVKQNIAITVGSNGYIVGANPTSMLP
jgi:filamentous hemagglutinin